MAANRGVKIIAVTPGGLAEGAGVSPGGTLLQVNGESVIDHLNYQFLVSQRDRTEILVKSRSGGLHLVVLENGGDALGLELAEDEIRTCRQNCVFCFVRQMPKGFRPSLYVKDEDIRLSFLHGHFTTLSNSDDSELDRIIRERLSPIHVSVHATDPGARSRLVGSPGQGDILRKMDRLIRGGIEMHTQAVVVPGYNDGETLERTLEDLWERRARRVAGAAGGKGGVLSLSCVPVGLTAHRRHLPPIQGIDAGYAAAWADKWEGEARRRAELNGGPWLLLADEWFTRAGLRPPGRAHYPKDWSQIENGVGLLRRFQEHSRRFLGSERAKGFMGLRLLLLTGASFAPYLSRAVGRLNGRVGSDLRVVQVANAAFGESVTVAGLLCGRDLLEAAREHVRCADGGVVDAVVIPGASVRLLPGAASGRPGGGHPVGALQFLDDATVSDLRSALGVPVVRGGENLSQLLKHVQDGIVGNESK
jgi:putative radical SAM enzyme (TIGR03279 family)